MKDALGHGSNPRGSSGFNAALNAAAHQVAVNSAAPNVAGHALYEQMSADHIPTPSSFVLPGPETGSVYSAKDVRDMLPDFDEFGLSGERGKRNRNVYYPNRKPN